MVIRISIRSLGKVFKAMVVELSEKANVMVMAKVSLQSLALFQALRNRNLEGTAVGEPMNPIRE
jgi:hypothetical protein